LEARIWIQIRIRVKSWIQIQNSICVKKKNPDPNPDPHQGDKSNPDPHQSEVDPQHCAKQSRVRIQLWIWFFFFLQMLFWIMILRNRFFFWFFTLEYIWYTKFWAASKKNPTSCMFGSPFACARIFFSPRNRASKMRERHQLFFGLRLLVSKEFRHLANKNRAALWRTLKFWNPSHATVPFSKKVVHSMRWKICFFFKYTANSFGMYVL